MQFVSIDFETANEKRFSPCAIGVVVANEFGIEEEYYSLINPLTSFSSFNIGIHGITEDEVREAPTYAEMWPKLRGFMENKLVIAHNASFDMAVIRHTLDYFQLPYPNMDYLCTANISKRVWPELRNHKLNTLARFHEIEFKHHHALEDAKVAANIFQRAFTTLDVASLDQLLERLGMTKGRIYNHGYYPPKAKRLKRRKKLYI